MAILKHIANKSKIYSGAEQYLCFEHDAKTGKPLLDDQGRMIARKGILKDAINCAFDSFDDYYNGLWDKYNAQNVNREIRTRGC